MGASKTIRSSDTSTACMSKPKIIFSWVRFGPERVDSHCACFVVDNYRSWQPLLELVVLSPDEVVVEFYLGFFVTFERVIGR